MQDIAKDPKKRTRVSKNKSKNGCRTCKARRVKCDERRDFCVRCERGNYECEGYEPRSTIGTDRATLPIITANFEPILYQPHKTLFLSDREAQYFRLFCDQMLPPLAGHFNSDLWSCLVLQTCEVNSSIRNAIVALGALNKTSKVLYSTEEETLERKFDAQEHHQFAIRQYSKAVQSMRKEALNAKQDLRMKLITCVVIVCFETFHGNHYSAAKQAVIGLDLIRDQSFARMELDSSLPSIEEELSRSFERLDIQTMSFIDPRAGHQHKSLRIIGQEKIESMPSIFETIEEARSSLELIMRRCLHFMASLSPEANSTGLLQADILSCLSDEHLEKRDRHLDEFRQWYMAFATLLTHATSPEGGRDFLRATSLQLQYLACFFIAAVVPSISQPIPDSRSFMPLFEQIVAGAEAILDHPAMLHKRGVYVFEMQVVCPLYTVAICCPQRTLRRKAISLLLSRPRRECLWDSIVVGKLAEWVMLIEEEDWEGEYVPENLRATGVNILSSNMTRRDAHVRCLTLDKESQEWRVREAVIYW